MKNTGYFIIIAIVLIIKAVTATLLWNYVILDIFNLQRVSVWQSILAVICALIIMLKVNIKK